MDDVRLELIRQKWLRLTVLSNVVAKWLSKLRLAGSNVV